MKNIILSVIAVLVFAGITYAGDNVKMENDKKDDMFVEVIPQNDIFTTLEDILYYAIVHYADDDYIKITLKNTINQGYEIRKNE